MPPRVHAAPLTNRVPLGHPEPALHSSSRGPSLSAQNFFYPPSLPAKLSLALTFVQDSSLLGTNKMIK